MKIIKLHIKKRFIIPLLALVVFAVIQLVIRFPHIAEYYYSQRIYPLLASAVSFFSKWVPVSLDDLFYFLLVVTGILIVIFLLLRKISLKAAGLIVLNVLAAVFILFYVLWGFNYFRLDINSRLDLKSHHANPEEFIKVFTTLVHSANNSYTSYEEFDEEIVASLIEDSYKRLSPALKLDYPAGSRRPKHITLSGFFAKAGISGYFGPFFNEVHINRKLLPVEYPFVLAHEKAHQFGITGEAEANFYAWLACSQSSSKQLQYSANLVAVRYFMYYGFRLEGYREIVSQLDERIIEDIRTIHKYWQGLRNEKVEAVASKVNDAYLKTNQVEKGIKDYTGIVRHIMDYSLDTAFREKAGF